MENHIRKHERSVYTSAYTAYRHIELLLTCNSLTLKLVFITFFAFNTDLLFFS
jgi:hypothetical protein